MFVLSHPFCLVSDGSACFLFCLLSEHLVRSFASPATPPMSNSRKEEMFGEKLLFDSPAGFMFDNCVSLTYMYLKNEEI